MSTEELTVRNGDAYPQRVGPPLHPGVRLERRLILHANGQAALPGTSATAPWKIRMSLIPIFGHPRTLYWSVLTFKHSIMYECRIMYRYLFRVHGIRLVLGVVSFVCMRFVLPFVDHRPIHEAFALPRILAGL